MDTYTLTIKCLGICTHFRHGVVAGVPHRIVLPDTTSFMSGFLTVQDIPQTSEAVLYYITPHFPALALERPLPYGGKLAASDSLTIPGLIEDGRFRTSLRMQIINAQDTEVVYADGGVASLTDFVPNYNFASDVVLNGRASCYFDLYGGTVASEEDKDGALRAVITVKTDGPPVLLVSRLDASIPAANASPNQGVKSYRLNLATEFDPREVTLHVRNVETLQEVKDEDAGGGYDYLLHYLTARGGIPQTIATSTPGMPTMPVSATAKQVADSMKGLAELLCPSPSSPPKPSPSPSSSRTS